MKRKFEYLQLIQISSREVPVSSVSQIHLFLREIPVQAQKTAQNTRHQSFPFQKTQKRRPASFGIWRNPQFRIANYTGRGLVRINRGSVSGRGVSQVLRLVTSRGLRMQQMLCFQKWGERIGFHLVSNPKHIVPHLEIKLFRSVLSL